MTPRKSIPQLAAILFAFTSVAALLADERKAPSGQGDGVLFSRDIQPVLAKNCLGCHGPDKAEGGLRLDSSDAAIAELDSGSKAIVPGDAPASELLARVTSTDESERMPPEGDPLSKRDIANLRQWIKSGARFEQHWAYRPISNPKLPPTKNQEWANNPIDSFVLARLEALSISPSPETDRATLIRRLYLDLIGLPPTPAEVDAFAMDTSPRAYENVVDHLLKSQHFGERWGRHWLDKARYADSDGYEKDRPRPNAWRYRDWVIQAVNDDMPYDQFTIEQLAGDLLQDPSPMQRLATAFHRQTLTNTEGGTDQEQFRVEATFDRAETTASIWLGLTMTCARCHTHKYDQITQREYYEFFAFFNDANETNLDVAKSDQALKAYEQAKQAHDKQVAELQNQYEKRRTELQPKTDAWLAEVTGQLTNSIPIAFAAPTLVESKTTSGAVLTLQEDASLLASGTNADKDEYTLVFEAPTLPVTGIKLDVLTDDSLPSKGPGRAENGNFVLSQVRAYVSDQPDFKENIQIEFTSAEADFSQGKFSPEGAISDKEKSGWAVSPQMGKNHVITLFTNEPIAAGKKYLQVVIDQQYGGTHTIGRFRVSTVSGFDPLRALPSDLASAVRTAADKRTPEQQTKIADHVAARDEQAAKLNKQITALKAKPPASAMMSVRVIAPANRATKVLHRGDFLQPADAVQHGTLAVVSKLTSPEQTDEKLSRLDLAGWLVAADNPLTSRVTVNQVWARLFGQGIVPTVNDFGVRGELPSHPDLLNWLAYQFPREMGWSRKTLIKTIVMSATYRQSSVHRAELKDVDETNRLLARQNRVRVEAEIVRDLHLRVSGLLSEKIGGPSVFPPLPPGIAELSYANNFKWKTSEGEDRYRRGMYTFFKRTSPYPTLVSFDCPDSNTTNLKRSVSNTPLQALTTLNNDVFTEAAQSMARRVLLEGGSDDEQRLRYALRLCISRQSGDDEVARFENLLSKARKYYQSSAEDAGKLASRHAAKDVAPAEFAAWVATLRIVLNLDEFIVRG
jgi:mono/diheme cytochrome c family protein